MPPGAIQELIRSAVLKLRDAAAWDAALAREAEHKQMLDDLVDEMEGRS